MEIIENEEGLIIGGVDINTGITYILFSKLNKLQF